MASMHASLKGVEDVFLVKSEHALHFKGKHKERQHDCIDKIQAWTYSQSAKVLRILIYIRASHVLL